MIDPSVNLLRSGKPGRFIKYAFNKECIKGTHIFKNQALPIGVFVLIFLENVFYPTKKVQNTQSYEYNLVYFGLF